MRLLITFLTVAFALIGVNANSIDLDNNKTQIVDDNISLDELILDDGKGVVNNQDTEKPKNSKE